MSEDEGQGGPVPHRPGQAARRSAGGVRLADVARAVGVSINTVSRALRAPNTVRPELRRRIEGEVERSGYVPNRLAGSLAGAHTNVVGVVITSLFYSEFAEIIETLQRDLTSAGLHVMIGNSRYDQEEERSLVRAMVSWRPAAIVLVGVDHHPRTLEHLRAAAVPVIEIWDLTEAPFDSVVGMDHHRIGMEQARHLLAAGCRALAFLGAVREHDYRARKRLAGFRAAAAQAGASVEVEIEPGGGSPTVGIELARRIFARAPGVDGIACNSDAVAFGVMSEFARLGRRIPEDVAVIGFGNNEACACMTPALSSVRPPRAEIGHTAAATVLSRIAGRPPVRHAFAAEVIGRASTARTMEGRA